MVLTVLEALPTTNPQNPRTCHCCRHINATTSATAASNFQAGCQVYWGSLLQQVKPAAAAAVAWPVKPGSICSSTAALQHNLTSRARQRQQHSKHLQQQLQARHG